MSRLSSVTYKRKAPAKVQLRSNARMIQFNVLAQEGLSYEQWSSSAISVHATGHTVMISLKWFNILEPELNGCHFAEDILMAFLWSGHHCFILTLNVRGSSYLGLTMSISWLLMPWFLTSPGHHQPWYWLCKIGRFLSYLRKDFNYLRRINVEIWHKM